MKILDNEFPPKQNSFDELQIQHFISQAVTEGEIQIRGSIIKYFPDLGILSLKAPDGKHCITSEQVIVTIIHSGISKIGNLNLGFKTVPELILVVNDFYELLKDSSQLSENERETLADMVTMRATDITFKVMLDAENSRPIAGLI